MVASALEADSFRDSRLTPTACRNHANADDDSAMRFRTQESPLCRLEHAEISPTILKQVHGHKSVTGHGGWAKAER